MKDTIIIYPDLSLLEEFLQRINYQIDKKKITGSLFDKEKADLITELLNCYNITDKQIIDTFCFITKCWHPGSKEGQKAKDEYFNAINELTKLKAFFNEHEIQSIVFKVKSITESLTVENSINISNIVNNIKFSKSFSTPENTLYFKKGKGRRPGHQKTGTNIKEEYIFIRNFLKSLHFLELMDLSETEENYFAGKLFLIAGIIPPKPYTTAYNRKKEKYYLVKTMQAYR